MRLSKMELMTEKPEGWATRAGSREGTSAVVSTTRVLGAWAAGVALAGTEPTRGSARSRMANRSLGTATPSGSGLLQEFAANYCKAYPSLYMGRLSSTCRAGRVEPGRAARGKRTGSGY